MTSSLWKRVDVIVNGRLPLSVFTSLRTGQRLAVGEVPGPMVRACVSLVTETTTDDGLPHTLEHLVFMGSQLYPFKGFLDVIANRCFASGTNAWTEQDHTAYTLDTVGAEGFYKVFPVYLNHILRPTLTVEQYSTEVHYVDEKGNDAGVVYCEMQDSESEMDSILEKRSMKLLYPPEHPYAANTGGSLEAIRELCSPDRVRAFHSKFYHLGNLLSIVCGRVDTERLLKILEELEETETERIPADFPTPFSIPVPSLKSSVVETVKCPADDPSCGSVKVNWLGPSARDIVTTEALGVLFVYLTDTTVSPFNKHFIDIPNPLASSASFHLAEQTTSAISLSFGGVATERLNDILPLLLDKVLKDHEKAETFDSTRMGFVCQQALLNAYASLETSAPSKIFGNLISHQLYGEKNEEDLKQRFDEVGIISRLAREPMQFWADLVARSFATPSVALIGQPDENHSQKLAEAESDRIAEQCKKLGDEGLEKCRAAHKNAVKANESNAPPAEILDSLMVRDLEEFDRFSLGVYHSDGATQAPPEAQRLLGSMPFPTTIHHTAETKFVELYLLLDTAGLSADQRRLLDIFKQLVFESAATLDGKRYTAEEVCSLYTRDLLEQSMSTGVRSQYQRALVLWLKVDVARFENLALWAEVFLRGVEINAERIKMIATRLAGDARESKRDGHFVCSTALSALIHDQDSNEFLLNDVVLQKVHEKLAERCKKQPAGVVQQFEELRTALLAGGINAHLLCDVTAIPENAAANSTIWQFAKNDKCLGRFELKAGESIASSMIGKEVVVPLGACESSFLGQAAPFEVTWSSPELMPTILLCQYLSQCEGPLWKSVRGSGMAYGVWITVNVDHKLISLDIYRSANVPEAYRKVCDIVKEEIGGNRELDSTQFEAAKRSLICELHSKESTLSRAGRASVLRVIQGNSPDYLRDFTARVWAAEAAAVREKGAPAILSLFSAFARSICTHNSKLATVKKAFPAIAPRDVKNLPVQP